jgi:hypothetical protein
MKSNQKIKNCTSGFPITVDFLDFGTVEQVVEAAFIRKPKIRRKKA